MKRMLSICSMLIVTLLLLVACKNENGECKHNYANATCTEPKTCTICNTTEGEPLGHSPNNNDGDCTTAIKCRLCNVVTTPAMAHDFTGTWENDDSGHWHKCKNEGCTITDTVIPHKVGANLTETSVKKCTACNCVITPEITHTHNYGDDCTKVVKCTICDMVADEVKTAHTPENDDRNCRTADKCKYCSKLVPSAENDHIDIDGDYLCDNNGCVFATKEVIIELANAYDRQGAQVLYDQYYSRRCIYASPEDATAQRTVFLDCSSYVNACYREAFGVNIMPYEIGPSGTSPSTVYYDAYARDNLNNIDVMGYWVPSNYPTEESKAELVESIYQMLEVGDVLTYRHGKSSATKGHVYIYIGNKVFMHCAGAGSYILNKENPALSYDSSASEIKSEGTIGKMTAESIFEDTANSRYIFKQTDSDTVYSFSIIRPMARGLTITEETLSRMAIPGVSMEKTASVYENSALESGSLLTYKITIRNTSDNHYPGIVITDVLPTGTEFVSADPNVNVTGDKLSFECSIGGKTTVEISYTVKITASTPGTLIVSNQTYVSGIKLGNITHTVCKCGEETSAQISEMAVGYNGSTEFASTIDMIKAVYSTLGLELFDEMSASAILDELIDTDKLTCRKDTELSKMLVPNMYGGQKIRSGWYYFPEENDKTRLPSEAHLSVGDIIVADWSGGSTVYLYAGNKTLVTVEDGVCKTLKINSNIYALGENKIISLLGYDRYAVLRPSMVMAFGDELTDDGSITEFPWVLCLQILLVITVIVFLVLLVRKLCTGTFFKANHSKKAPKSND